MQHPQSQALSLPWQHLPLNLCRPQQKARLDQQVKLRTYRLGELIWDTEQTFGVGLLLSGRVRLSETNQPTSITTLRPGAWFGDPLDLSGSYRIVASSREVRVAWWENEVWRSQFLDLDHQFWLKTQQRYHPQHSKAPKPVPGFPFVFSLNDSAAACLTMAAQSFQIPVELNTVSSQLHGQKPEHLIEASDLLGLSIQHLRSDSNLAGLPFPVLIYWKRQTWMVLYAMRGNRLIVANPTDADELCKEVAAETMLSPEVWTGDLWQIEPQHKSETFNLKWFLPTILQYRWLLVEVILLSIVLQALGIATPLLTQVIIDKAMINESRSLLNVIAIALLVVTVFESAFSVLRLYLFTHTANRIDLRLSSQVFRHLIRLPLAYFESRRVGDTVARVQELEKVRQFLTGTALTVLLDSIFVFVYLGVMLMYSQRLTLVTLATIPLYAGLTLIATPVFRHWLSETFDRGADSQSFLTEALNGMHAVKAHGVQKSTRSRWEGLYARYIRTSFRAATTSNLSGNLADLLKNLSSLVLLWVGAALVMEGQLKIGQLIAFQMLAGHVTDPILRLIQLWQNLQQVLLSVDRLGDILNTPPEVPPGSGRTLPPLQGAIAFEHVFFRYKLDQEPILRGISFDIQPGMFVGIVGRSGSGKSTLSKLLQRLYDVESGKILLDGYDAKTADIASLQSQIAIVLQEDFLFKGTIAENIAIGKEDVTQAEIERAARQAAAHSFITNLSAGYATPLGERGVGLSGGQQQRIALARLFLSQAPILILDEATSALDSETERTVLDSLRQTRSDRTVLMITHRFAPLRQADLILVLQDGILAEQGTHLALMAQRGLYWMLYQRQLETV